METLMDILGTIQFEDVPVCPVCLSDNTTELITDVEKDRPSQAWKICLNCEHTYVSPRPSDEFLTSFYTEGYRRMVYRLKEKESKEVMPVNSVNEERNRAMRLGTLIMGVRSKVTSHLDIGSSTGALCAGVVDFLKPAFSWGVEPNDAWRGFAETAFAKRDPKFKLYEDNVRFAAKLSEVPKTPKFDLVTVIHTLEHMADPRGTLVELRKRMKLTGLLVVEVPNRYGGIANPLMWPHLHCFTEFTLDRLLAETGFFPILHESLGNFPPFFPPPQTILVVAGLKPPEISLVNVLMRYNQYRAVIGDLQKRVAQAKPQYDIG